MDCHGVLTSPTPFDVVKTRLQTDLFRHKHSAVRGTGNSSTVVIVQQWVPPPTLRDA
jgi:hypothetical protein